jgi:magnesium-transporting ATPase (P-type)
VRLVKEKKKKITLAIGDGANDVGMIQLAHVGIGISGKEGAQAALASDFAIPQFRFLEQMLLVHGRWAFQRLSLLVIYSYFRGIGWTLTSFFFSFDILYSGGQFWNNFFAGQWTGLFTEISSYATCILNRDFQYQSTLLALPELYCDVQNGRPFSRRRFYGWMVHSVWIGLASYYLPMWALPTTTQSNGLDTGISLTSYTAFAAICIAVNLRLALEVQSWTRWTAGGFFFSLVIYWGIAALYTSIPPSIEFLFIKPAQVYWMFYVQFVNWGTWAVILLTVVVALAPLILFQFWRALSYPMTLSEAARRREYRMAKEQARLDRRLAEEDWYRLLVLQKERGGVAPPGTPANTHTPDGP